MSDKLTAGLVTFAAILPLCSICVLGPAAAGSLLAGVGVWLGGFGVWVAIAIAVGAAAAIYRLTQRRRRRCDDE